MVAPCTSRKEPLNSADLYSTPQIALEAIKPFLEEDIAQIANQKVRVGQSAQVSISEPCNGLGNISNWLKGQWNQYISDLDVTVRTNELNNWGVFADMTQDFLNQALLIPDTYDMIVTNSPYNKAVEFIKQGFQHAPVQWQLLRFSFLEGQKRYSELFSLGHLTDVYIFSYRISCPKGIAQEKGENAVCYCWYRFDRDAYVESPQLHWLVK